MNRTTTRAGSGFRITHIITILLVIAGVGVAVGQKAGQMGGHADPQATASEADPMSQLPTSSPGVKKKHTIVFRLIWNSVPADPVEVVKYQVGAISGPPGKMRRWTKSPYQSARIPYDGESEVSIEAKSKGRDPYKAMWISCEIYHFLPGEGQPEIWKEPVVRKTSPALRKKTISVACIYKKGGGFA
jgi:hypothetical protein